MKKNICSSGDFFKLREQFNKMLNEKLKEDPGMDVDKFTDEYLPILDTSIDLCPNCGINLAAGEIPEKSHRYFGASHFSNKIAIYDMYADRTTHYECPSCKGRIER